MAVTASGLLASTWEDIFDATQLAFNYLGDDIKVALFTNSITPNFATDTAYGVAPYDANEVAGAGYSAGGVNLGTKTCVEAGGYLAFDAADTSWTTATITDARAALIYDDTLGGNNGLALIDFGGDFSTTAGTFLITWDSDGIWRNQLYTP